MHRSKISRKKCMHTTYSTRASAIDKFNDLYHETRAPAGRGRTRKKRRIITKWVGGGGCRAVLGSPQCNSSQGGPVRPPSRGVSARAQGLGLSRCPCAPPRLKSLVSHSQISRHPVKTYIPRALSHTNLSQPARTQSLLCC
jgi:hypothetical protein